MVIQHNVRYVPRLKRQQDPLPVLLRLPRPEVGVDLDPLRRPSLHQFCIQTFRRGVEIGGTIHRRIVWSNGPGF
jgi:hypothetical protein